MMNSPQESLAVYGAVAQAARGQFHPDATARSN
jgi:hypothetical protein